jgi:hypothetical protein
MPRSRSSNRGRKKPSRKLIEQYEHTGEERLNNPPVGLVKPENDPDAGKQTYQYDPHLDPQLVWAGKAEHTSFEVPTVSPGVTRSGEREQGQSRPVHGHAHWPLYIHAPAGHATR